MEIIQNKALLIDAQQPTAITYAIPKSKQLEGNKVLVHWGLEECKVLQNLGYDDVPSPIEKDYTWAGMYTPFAHQKVTAGKAVLNRRMYILNDMGCVDSETEYLTPTGWKNITQYNGETVAQYNPETKHIEFVVPSEYIKLPCASMLRIKTKYGLDQMLSHEHRVLLHDGVNPSKWVVNSAQMLKEKHDYAMCGVKRKRSVTDVGYTHASIPAVYNYTWGKGMDISIDQLKVQVAVIADGYFGSNTNHCVVRLKRKRKIERLHQLLQVAGIAYEAREQTTETAKGFVVFKFAAPIRVKEFDTRFWECSQEQIDAIYSEVLHWDGSYSKGESKRFARFSSNSRQTIDFVQAVFNSKGHIARVSLDPRTDKYKHGVHYLLQIRRIGKGMLQLKNHAHEVITEVPSTDGYKYCFSVPSTFLLLRRNGCVFATGNSGKTASVAWAADYLMQQGLIKKMLIICPVSIMRTAWQNDLFKTVMHRTVGIAHGSKETRKQVIAAGNDITIINYDGVEIVLPELLAADYDLIVLDEATAIKKASTRRWKAINQLVKPQTWLWLMTGTPAAQSPVDAYGLIKLMHPSKVDSSEYKFKDRVMYKVTQFMYKPKADANAYVHALMQPSVRFSKEECLDLPELMYMTREVEMSAQQKHYYKRLKDQMLCELGDESITAMNAAILLNKLLQIAAGSAYTDTKEVIDFDCSSRYNELVTCIEDSTHSVLVFCTFRHSISMLENKLRTDGYIVDVIHGEVSMTKRTEIFKTFQESGKKQVLLIQPQSAAHGVTLHAANTVVWWSPTTSYEIYAQANARVHRAGQVNRCNVIHLQGSSVEKKLYTALEQRSEQQMNLLDLFKFELGEK